MTITTSHASAPARCSLCGHPGPLRNGLDQALKRAALAGDTRVDYRPRKATA